MYGVKAQFLGNTDPRGDAMEYLIVLMVVLLTVIAMLYMKFIWFRSKNRTVYVCDLCDEHHCECIRK